MKKANAILVGCFLLLVIISVYNSQSVLAAGTQGKNVDVNGNKYQGQLKANERTTYQFQQQTMLTIRANVSGDLDIECDGNKMGNKEFEMEIEAENAFQMTMTCTQEREELGLMNGSTIQTRNQHRYRYQEGFIASIECNEQVQATLKLKSMDQTQTKTWAYYDETEGEWVSVQSSMENGYVVANTNHFSTWTVLTSESQNGKTEEVGGNKLQTKLKANEKITYQFQQQTKLTFSANVNVELDVECDGNKIGNKEFEMEIEGEKDIEMTMICEQERQELGLMNGSTIQTRDQNRYRYLEGAVFSIECNDSIQAKLKLKSMDQTQTKTWAYYDETEGEWVPVQSSMENGYVVANTNHFSTWTVLTLEAEQEPISGFVGFEIISLIGVLATVAIVFVKKKK